QAVVAEYCLAALLLFRLIAEPSYDTDIIVEVLEIQTLRQHEVVVPARLLEACVLLVAVAEDETERRPKRERVRPYRHRCNFPSNLVADEADAARHRAAELVALESRHFDLRAGQ